MAPLAKILCTRLILIPLPFLNIPSSFLLFSSIYHPHSFSSPLLNMPSSCGMPHPLLNIPSSTILLFSVYQPQPFSSPQYTILIPCPLLSIPASALLLSSIYHPNTLSHFLKILFYWNLVKILDSPNPLFALISLSENTKNQDEKDKIQKYTIRRTIYQTKKKTKLKLIKYNLVIYPWNIISLYTPEI